MNVVIVKRSKSFRIVVSRKVAATAVQRNLIRRRLKEAIRAINIFSTSLPGITVIALPSIVGKRFQEIKTLVHHTLKDI